MKACTLHIAPISLTEWEKICSQAIVIDFGQFLPAKHIINNYGPTVSQDLKLFLICCRFLYLCHT